MRLDRSRVREVTGVFHSRDALNGAVADLLHSGFDRANIDVVASLDEVSRRLGIYVGAEAFADVPTVPRRPFFGPEDVTLIVATVAAIFAAAGGMFAALWAVNKGDSSLTDTSCRRRFLLALYAESSARQSQYGSCAKMTERDSINSWPIAAWCCGSEHARPNPKRRRRRFYWRTAVLLSGCTRSRLRSPLKICRCTLRPDPWLGSEPLGNL
jgi:hypothetical protein